MATKEKAFIVSNDDLTDKKVYTRGKFYRKFIEPRNRPKPSGWYWQLATDYNGSILSTGCLVPISDIDGFIDNLCNDRLYILEEENTEVRKERRIIVKVLDMA